jgi:hypothetical protein
MALETRAWIGWCFVRLPTTEGVCGNKANPIVFSWLSYTRRFDDRGGRHVKRTRETSWRRSLQHAGEQWQRTSAHDTESRLGRRKSGTHQNRTVCGALRANSGETGGRKTWDASLCIQNPRQNRDRDDKTTTPGWGMNPRKKKTQWESLLGWEMEGKGL